MEDCSCPDFSSMESVHDKDVKVILYLVDFSMKFITITSPYDRNINIRKTLSHLQKMQLIKSKSMI